MDLPEAKYILGMLAGRESGILTPSETRDAARAILDYLEGEPSDEQVLAGLNAAQEEDWRQSGYREPRTVSADLTDWHPYNIERMRAALRAAKGE